ncbi:DUF58 domain-containing protein [Rossellomorea aquimaris]|uniref:DUF58 domain-containing protein n=1 Tax=Rossellomorea aquimaris TaxID=189382 RepID=UPI0007D0927B|nr:DUF58 domain-containing protein [Rossellomorea aquimaris]
MNWKREIVEDSNTSISMVILVIAGTLSLYFQSYIGLGLFLLTILYFRVHQWYLMNIGKEITMGKSPKRIRLHCDDDHNWEFQIENNGLPIWGATMNLTFEDIVEPTSHPYATNPGNILEVSMPISIGRGEIGHVSLPIKGKRRGLCKIKTMQLEIPHLFGSGKVLLNLLDPVPSTIMVFPTASPVIIEEDQRTFNQGDVFTPSSLFYDVFHPIGTREYVAGDRFQDVNWKASARTGQLQTKVFEPATQKEWMIAINLSSRYSITDQIESIIKHTSYLMHLAVEKNISFSLVLNVRIPGLTPYYFLPSGTGRKHRQKGLELLSTLSRDDFTIPFNIALQHLYLRKLVPPVLIVAGELDSKEEERLLKISKSQTKIFKLNTEEKQGVVTIWNRKLKLPS